MNVKLSSVAYTRSGDKGCDSNVGVIFINHELYTWAKDYLTSNKVKNYFGELVKGDVIRYELDNLFAFNFILHDSLGGGGSESLLNDAQGKTHGQSLLLMEIDLPNKFKDLINE